MKMPLVFRAWCALMDALHVRTYEVGDSTVRYILTEPWDASATYGGRLACRVLRRHNLSCRGRADHPKGAR